MIMGKGLFMGRQVITALNHQSLGIHKPASLMGIGSRQALFNQGGYNQFTDSGPGLPRSQE